jgi:hypothetical protein
MSKQAVSRLSFSDKQNLHRLPSFVVTSVSTPKAFALLEYQVDSTDPTPSPAQNKDHNTTMATPTTLNPVQPHPPQHQPILILFTYSQPDLHNVSLLPKSLPPMPPPRFPNRPGSNLLLSRQLFGPVLFPRSLWILRRTGSVPIMPAGNGNTACKPRVLYC